MKKIEERREEKVEDVRAWINVARRKRGEERAWQMEKEERGENRRRKNEIIKESRMNRLRKMNIRGKKRRNKRKVRRNRITIR